MQPHYPRGTDTTTRATLFLTLVLVTMLCGLLVGRAAAQCTTPRFAGATNFTAGDMPRAVTTGDFNADGRLDLAVANSGSNNVSILMNNGLGSFGAAANFAVGEGPFAVVTGEFNGDGRLDLAVANLNSDNVSLLLGNGLGGFSAPTNFAVGDAPQSLTTGDFNQDGRPDLATANVFTSNVSILLGNGLGSFSAATNFPVGASPYGLTTADLNGDGRLDLAVANYNSDNVSILLNNGMGSFSAATNFPAGDGPFLVTTGDFNADGRLDLAVSNNLSNNVSILLNSGLGGFSAPTNFAAGASPAELTTGDFNADGRLDLAVANIISQNVSILLGNGLGGFSAPTNFAVSGFARSVTTGDFNSDGRPDLATANVQPGNVSIMFDTCGLAGPTIAKSFTPATINAGASSQLTLTFSTPAGNDHLTDLAVTDNLPVGVTVTATPGLSNTCGGTVAGATAGSTSLSLSGGMLNAGASCQVQVNVIGLTLGSVTNTTGNVTASSSGINIMGNAASAALTVNIPNPVVSVSAASYSFSAIASRAIIAAFGQAMATGTAAATSLPLPTSLAGTTVKVVDNIGTERLAPLFYVSPTQVNYQIPDGTRGGLAGVIVTSGDGRISNGVIQVSVTAPSLFTLNASGTGAAAAVDALTGAPAPFSPRRGSGQPNIISFYGTGLGADATDTGSDVNASVQARIDGAPVSLLYAGPAPGFVGLNQWNIVLPSGISSGMHTVVVSRNGVDSNTVTIAIQ